MLSIPILCMSLHAGSLASSMFYEELQAKYGSFGVTIIAGEINRGKSKSVELALAAFGVRNARYSSISNALLRKLLLGGMPWVLDDPNNAEQLMNILLSVFGGTTMGNALTSGSCRVSPLATANMHILRELASMDKRSVYWSLIVSIIIQLWLLYSLSGLYAEQGLFLSFTLLSIISNQLPLLMKRMNWPWQLVQLSLK